MPHQVAFELATGEPVGDGPQRNNRTGVRNVSRRWQRWRVAIGHNGRSIYVGTFDSLGEADAAARAKRNALFTANFADRASAT